MTVIVKDANANPRSFRTRTRNSEHMAVQAVEPPDSVTLATALTTGSSATLTVGFDAGETVPGFYQLTIWGTAGTSSCKVQFSPNGGTTWIDTDVSNVLANSIIGFTLVEGAYRLTVVTSGGGSSWSADFRGA